MASWYDGASDTGHERARYLAAVYNGKLYVYGGGNDSATLDILRIYDASTDTWSDGAANTGHEREWGRGAVLGTKIAFFGGENNNGDFCGDLYLYDPANDTWETKASGTANIGFAMASLGGKLYVFGGFDNANNFNAITNLRVYDPDLDSWSELTADTGHERTNHTLVAYSGKLYAFGGASNSFPFTLDTLRIYDPNLDSWSSGASDTDNARDYHGAAVIGSTLYIFAGEPPDGPLLDTMRLYDLIHDSWSAGTDDTGNPRQRLALVAISGRLYAFGGRNSDGYLDILRIYGTPPVTPLTVQVLGRTRMGQHDTQRHSLIVGPGGVTAGAVVAKGADGVVLCDGSATPNVPFGIAMDDALQGQYVSVVTQGAAFCVTDASEGSAVYPIDGVPGAVSHTPSTTKQSIGVAMSGHTIFVRSVYIP